MVVQLYKENILLTGSDSGNNSNKICFLDQDGNIQALTVTTVVAPAPSSKVNLNNKHQNKELLPGEYTLHVRLDSEALPADKKNSFWYVGEYAKDKKDKEEPNGDTQDKFNNPLHIITTLTGLAVAAVRAGKNDVVVPYSGGLPIEEYKRIGAERVLDNLIGHHEIEFIDGEFEGKTVKLHIPDGTVNVEGVTSSLALIFDIENGRINQTNLADEIGEHFALGDLGAGTDDLALYDETGLNKTISTNNEVGTNAYIDSIINRISEMEEFKDVRDSLEDDEDKKIFRTREELIRKVIRPEVIKMIMDEQYQPSFKVSWLWVKDIDATSIILDEITNYAEAAIKDLNRFWGKARVDKFVLVGGGLLFGYYKLRDHKNRFIFPPKLEDAAHFTARAYLISNYLEQLEKVQA